MNKKIAYPEVWVRFSQEEKPHRAILGAKTFCGKSASGMDALGGGYKSDEICQECLSKMKEKREGKFDPMSLIEKSPEPKPKKKSKKKLKKKLKEKSQDDVNTVEFKTLNPDTD